MLDDIVSKYNNTIHKTIKMKPIEVTDDYYVKDLSMELHSMELYPNKKNPKFKVDDNVRISKYKNIFAKGCNPNGLNFNSNGLKLKIQFLDLNGEEITGSFYEKELQKTSQKEFRIEKVLKRKGDKLYFKWKGYNNSFNSWINKKDLVASNV